MRNALPPTFRARNGDQPASCRRSLLHLIRPSHAHDLEMLIGLVVPESDGKSSGDVNIQVTPVFIPLELIHMMRRIIPNGLESREQKLPLSLSRPAQEFEHCRINQQPPFHSPAGSGIFSSRSRTSSSVSQRFGFGSSSTEAISRRRSAHCFSRSEKRKAESSRRAPSSSAAISRFSVSKLMRGVNHSPASPVTPRNNAAEGRAGILPAVPGILPGTPGRRGARFCKGSSVRHPMRRVEYPARRVGNPPYPCWESRDAMTSPAGTAEPRR